MPVSKHTRDMSGIEWIKKRNKRAVAKILEDKATMQREIRENNDRITKQVKEMTKPKPEPKKPGLLKRIINKVKNK